MRFFVVRADVDPTSLVGAIEGSALVHRLVIDHGLALAMLDVALGSFGALATTQVSASLL